MFSRLDLGTQLTQAVSRDTAEMISKKPVVVDIPVFCAYAPSAVLARLKEYGCFGVDLSASGGRDRVVWVLAVVLCMVVSNFFVLLPTCGQIFSA